MKILHTADIHLREFEDERWKALEKLIEVGKKEKIEILIISGDLFDKDINAETLKTKIRQIFSNNGYKIVVIPGNHDSDSYKSGMYFGEDIIVLNDLNKPYEYKDINIWGFPFEKLTSDKIIQKLHSLKNSLTNNKKNILLYHGELLDSFYSRKDFGEEGDEKYMPVKLSYFKDLNIEYVLGGHFHSKFDMWQLENGGYFVYPGSPVSITKRETGKRKVNLFEIGKKPKEYLLDTSYFEEVTIRFDPFNDKNPIEVVSEYLKDINPEASLILSIGGYFNGLKMKINEQDLVKKIKDVIKDKNLIDDEKDTKFEFKDINRILEDDLFKIFINKLNESAFDAKKKKELQDMTIKSMMEIS